MHDCALGRDGEPSAPRVEHTSYAGDGIDGKTRGGGDKNVKVETGLFFFIYRKFEKSGTKRL